MSGFIKLHRRMLQWEWATTPSTLVVFVHLLLRANYEPRRWRGLDLLPGQVVTGRAALAEQTGLSEKQIRTALKNLEKTGEVAIKTTRQFSLISITKWADYQDRGQQRANEGPTEGQQRATLKESKKVRREESKTPPIAPPRGGEPEGFADFWEAFPRQRRGSKDKAKRAYAQALKRASAAEIAEGLELYVKSKDVADGYAKGAAAWLNDDRWADRPPPKLKAVKAGGLFG
jgi:biotin operon repressor